MTFTKFTSPGFSRIDLLVTVGILALLVLVKMSAFGTGRESGQSIACMNNLRRLGQAALMYSAENRNFFPERASNPSWPERLHRYFGDVSVLHCPSDVPYPATFGGADPLSADAAPRSYIFNGFNDYFWGFPTNHAAVPESGIREPAGTILLGEKGSSSGHFWMDYWTGDDISESDHGRHFKSPSQRNRGGSNYAFADGSVRFLPFGQALVPTNLWAIDEDWRTNVVVLGPNIHNEN